MKSGSHPPDLFLQLAARGRAWADPVAGVCPQVWTKWSELLVT